MRFHIVVPTYHRPAKLEKMFNSLINQNLDNELIASLNDKLGISLYVYFDNNDEDSYRYFSQKYGNFFLTNYKLLNRQYRAFGIWNLHLSTLDADGMFYVCDDIEFRPDCIMIAIKTFLEKFSDTDGLLGLNQENIKKDQDGFSANAMGLIGKKFAERFPNRQCFCPDYISFHADAELGNFARSIDKFYFCKEAKIIHYHPNYFKDLEDETHKIVREPKNIDRETWNLRRKRNLLWGQSFELIH